MYKIGKWLYELGLKNGREKVKNDLYFYIGQEPIRYSDVEHGMTESEASFKKRVDGWFAAREILNEFFREDDREDFK